jgi:hypothetical protein
MSPFGLRWLRVFFLQALFMLCLTVSASAQSVDSVLFTLDTTPIIDQFGLPFTHDTVRGSIQNLAADSVSIGFESIQSAPPQWVINTNIPGTVVIGGKVYTIRIAPQ